MANEDRLKLFKAIGNAGYDIGNYEDFDRRMNNPEDRQKFYTAVNNAGFDIGPQEDFERRISPSKYKITVNGNDVQVSEKEYTDFLKRHPSGSNARPQTQPQPKPQQAPAAASQAPAVDAPEDKAAGTPWGTAGSGTGQSREYKPFAPGQVRTTEQPDGIGYNAPFRQDLSVAQHAEIERMNDYTVRQLQKMKSEEERRSQPLVDTGSPEANQHVVRTQGQWEDEVQQGVNLITSSVVDPAVDKAIAEFDKKASEVFNEGRENTNTVRSLPTGQAGGFTILGNVREANEAKDPEKILSYLQQQMEGLYKDSAFAEEVGKEADKMGIDRTEYIENIIKPKIQQDLATRLTDTLVKRELPKSSVEYIMNGLGNSIIGMLYNTITESKGQRQIKNQAEAMTEEGLNPNYNPGTGAKLAQMGVSFAADAPFFGLYGKVSGQVAKKVAERQIQNLMGKGLSETAARSIVGAALENSVGARMKNYLMQHVISSSLTMGGYNATSEAARQMRDSEFDPMRLAGSTAEGLATGAAFGVTGAVSQALSQPLSGISRVGAKAAGFAAEAETMYATEELAKMLQGEEGFTNPFEGSLEAMEKLGVMKASGGHLLTKALETGADIYKNGVRQAVSKAMSAKPTGMKFTKEEEAYVRDTAEGRSLLETLSDMHPDAAFSEVNGKKKLTPEGEQMRRQLADNYNAFMSNTEIPAVVKQKVAGVLGGVYRPGLETGADIVHNADGSVIVKTRDKDGNCVRDLKFDSFSDAEQWREECQNEFSLNDAVNMWNATSQEQRAAIVNEIAETNGISVKDAADIVQKALDSKDTSLDSDQFNNIYGVIARNAFPEDEYNPRRRFEEGKKITPEERHFALVDAQVAEESLAQYGQDFAEEVMAAAEYPDEKMAELAMRKDVTGPMLNAAKEYFNAAARMQGMMDQAIKTVDEQVDAANAEIRRNTHPDSGMLITGNSRGRDVYVSAGHFQITPEGKLVSTDGSGAVIVRDANTGEIDVINPNDVVVTGVTDPRRLIEANDSMDGLRGQLMKVADDSIELAPGTPETPQEMGETFVGADGKMYMVTGEADETGNVVWLKMELNENGDPVGEPQPLDIDEYRKSKSDEIDAVNRPQEEQQPITMSPESDQVTEEQSGGQNTQSGVLDNATGEGFPSGTTEEGNSNQPRSALSRIPVDEKGKKVYEKATPEDTMAELTEKYGEEKASEMIAKIAESAAREYDKLQQTDTSSITDMADLEAHEDKLIEARQKAEYWQDLVRRGQEAEAKLAEAAAEDIQQASEEVPAEVVSEGNAPVVVESNAAETVGPESRPAEVTSAGPEPLEVDQTTAKLYQKRVEANIGRMFTFTKSDGGTSVMTIQRIDNTGNTVLTRQDFDASGNPVGEPREVRYHFTRVADAIGKGKWKKHLTTDEELRQYYKYHNRKSGGIPIIDVLNDNEKQQILDALRSGDIEKAGYLEGEFINQHREDFILRGREIRNEKVGKAMSRGSRAERLRAVRDLYRDFDDSQVMLSDESMQPQSIEEYVANAMGDVPKPGDGFLAYTSYDQGDNTIVGLKDETGFGSRGLSGDTKALNPWLAPKGKGISLKQFAEAIHESLPEGMKEQYSDQDIRNAILNVMTGAEKPTDITNYILRNRLNQAEASANHTEEQWMESPNYLKVVDQNSFANRLQRGKESVNTEPTEGQKKAGNYKKGHISFGGYDFTIENPEGTMRRGVDADGKAWEQKMNNTYGYILGKFGKDGDHLDMFINDAQDLDNWNGNVYVIDQVDPKTGKFDEHKVMYGFDSLEEAREAYLSNYQEGWKGLGKITGISKEGFDKWLDSSKRKYKEFADHSIAKDHRVEQSNRAFDSALQKLDQREISIDDPELLKEYGLKNVTLSRLGDHVTLTHFVVDNQGQGNGTRFMEDLTRLADEKGWTLDLTPDTSFGATSVNRLKDFYKRFGFKDNKGRNTDFFTRESMVRRPKDWQPMTPEQQEQVLRDAVVDHLRQAGIEVSTDWKEGQKILDDYNSRVTVDDSESMIKSQKVTDQKELDELNKGKTVKRYRAMQLIDGKLYPPMSAKVEGEMREPTEIGVWEKAEERPDLIKNGKFVLNKGQKGQSNVPAAYNPYFHTSTSGLNDQFTSAYKRPELVVVEVEIPESELTSGYRAEGAKDAVGNVDWHSGVVNGQLPADRQRQVTLSRYSKVNRIVPDSEVADMIAKQLEGTNVEVPYNVVTPGQRAELEKRGVKISAKPAGSVTEDINGNPIKQHKVYHGSGAEFDAFDHSHMGEGQGSQSFGYGTYVTKSKDIGTRYAHMNYEHTPEHQAIRKRFLDVAAELGHVSSMLQGKSDDALIKTREVLRDKYNKAKAEFEESKKKGYLYDVEIPEENEAYYIDYEGKMANQKDVMEMVDNALTADGWKRQEIDSRVKFTKGNKQIILTPNQSGADLYAELEDALGSDKAASEFLHNVGVTGIKYPAGTIMGGGDGATNYVIFDEGDAKITNKTKFFKTPDGHAYGYTYKGKIYLDPRIATSETPVHEYGHLWAEMKRQTSPEEWNDIKQVMLTDKLVQPILDRVKRDYPELAKEGKEDDFIEEVITQFSGKRGAERLREIANEVAAENGGVFGKAEAVTAMQRLKNILNRFWEGVAKMMGWKYRNANQIADRILADMLNGVDPRERMRQAASGKLRSQAEIERTLMGVHNLSEDKLRKVLKQGGLANPSLAVVDTKNHMHTDYGDISLIPKSSLIDSRTGNNAGTFTADAWTPTYPQVQKRMSDKGMSKFWKDIRSLNEEAGEVASYMRMAFDTWLDKEAGQERLAYWYMKEKGLNPELVLNENPYGEEVAKRIDELTDKGNLEVRNLPEEQIKEIADMYHAYKESTGEPVTPAEERIAKLKERIKEDKNTPFTNLQRARLEELEKYGELLHNLNNFEYAVGRSAVSEGKPNVEETISKAAKAVKEQNLQQDFDKWLQDKADSYGVEEWLFNGTDYQGRQKWVRNTLENASKLMKKEGLNGATNWSSIGNWIAKVASKEKTLEGIRKNKANLNTTKEEHEAFHEEWGQKLRAIADKLGNGDWYNGENILGDALDHYKNISSYLKREYNYDLSAEDRQTIEQFVNAVQKKFPTGYFETKFERPVYLNEFAVAVVPENTSPDIIEALKNSGLDVRTYDNTGTEDQKDANRKQVTMDAVGGRDDIMFQMVGKEGAQSADKAEGGDERSRNLTLAEDSEKAGVDPKAIKYATGWERGADGQWRYEIPDADVDIVSKYKQARLEHDQEVSRLGKEEDNLLQKYQILTNAIPGRIDSRYSEEQKAKYREMRKQKEKIWKQYLEAGNKVKEYDEQGVSMSLGELMGEDNELFKYYPELKDLKVAFTSMQGGTAGSFGEDGIKIGYNELKRFGDNQLNNENVYGTLLHEIQHAIQDIEGFAQGGNLYTSTSETGINAIIAKKEAEKANIKTELDAINKILSSSPEEKKDYAALVGRTVGEYTFYLQNQAVNLAGKYDNINQQIDRLRETKAPAKSDALDLYHRLAGEVEARNVDKRLNMSEEERRNSLASETEDVPRDDQVIIMDDGTSMNIKDIKPVGTGDFGEVYDQFKGKPKEAVDFLVKKKGGDLLGVFHRDEVGDIDLVWGESHNPYKGKGLSHIIRKHIETLHDFKDIDELSAVLDDVVNNGSVGKNGNNIEITKDGYRVVLAQEDNGKKWVLTAFDNSKTKKEKLSSANTAGTPIDTSGSRAVAADDNISFSEGKVTENIPNDQENKQKSSDEAPKFQKADGDIHSDNFKNFFGDWEKEPEKASKIVDNNGKPMVLYHQTGNDFTVFDPRHNGAGTNDFETPFGIFMKPTSKDIGVSGNKQMPLYANIRNPFEVTSRKELSEALKKNVPGYKDLLDEYNRIDQEYSDRFKEAEKYDHDKNVESWNKKQRGEITEEEYENSFSFTEEKVLDEWREAIKKPMSDMKELLDKWFRDSDYDGVVILNDEGSFGRKTQTIIALDPNQVKSATDNVGTYNPENPDIRYQREGSPEPEMTAEERQYWNKWDADMKKWRERNAIEETATGPSEKPKMQQGEAALDYAKRLVQWNREKSLWQTAPKIEDYRQKRDDKDVLEAARENERRYPDSPSAKMRRVAAELLQIRHAMSQQKAYDKATVKAVTDFAQEFMKMGFGDNLRRGEMERMLSAVKNATGAKDIKREIDSIMNILVDNQLRNLDQRVTKLSSTKELSKTAQGVEKQGKLELKGQRMIQAFRQAREGRMDAEKIRERMNEVAEKMARNDEEAPMWEQEYEGLSIALQYQENIEASRDEYAELDRVYKDAVENYKGSGRSYKAQQELLEAIDQAMMENKIERIGLFGDIIGRLEGNIGESMQGAKEFVERDKERVKHIQQIANFDLAGKSADAMREKQKGKPANFFLQPLATFEQMLRQFGSRNASGEGHLYNYFLRNWIDSVDKSYVNEQKAKEELDAKAREVFGNKVKRWSDLYELERRLPTMEVEVLDGENPKTFTLNQGNLLYIYMADKMADGRMKLRNMGIDEEHVEAIKDFLDPRLKELGDWLQDEYLPSKRTGYNKVHERMFGAPMAAIDNYFPLRILGDARYQEQDVANMQDPDAVLPSTITGNIIKRRKNALPLDILHTDALSLAIEHVEDMERWAATAEWNRDVNTLLSYTTFRNKVKNMDTIYGSGDALWNSFADTARMAAGTYSPKAKPGSVDKAISNIAKGVTAAKINFRVYTAFKQILSAPAFLHDVNLGDFVKDSMNPYGSWKWAMENMPVFKKRWKSRQVGDTRLMDDPTDWKMWKTNIVQMATRLGMSPNALVDGVTCAVGAKAIYETRYKKYKKLGASDEVARKRALQDAEIGYNLTQQSSEGAFVSAIQKDRTVAANMLSVFRNSSMAYTRQWVDAARNLSHRAQKGYKEDSIKFMTRQFQEQFDLDEAEARQAAEKEYARAARHDVARLLNMMFGVTTAWNIGASLPYLLMGDDDETKKEMLTDAAVRAMIAGPTEGLAAGNLFSEFISRTAASEETRKTIRNEGWGAGVDAALKQGGDYEVNPLPLMADIQGMIKKMGYDKYAAAQDVFNICMQSAVGVNPQTFTDMWNACMDYGNPDWMPFTKDVGNDDLANSKEIALFIMRLMNAPTSSWRNKYIDELGMNVEDAKKLPYEEMARRYANYKHWKDAPVMGWLRGDDKRQEKMDKIQKQFDKAVEQRMERLTDKELMHNLARSESAEEKRKYAKIIAQRMGVAPVADLTAKQDLDKNWYQHMYQERMEYEDIREEEMLDAKLKDYRESDASDRTKAEVKKRLDWIRNGKYDTPSGRKGTRKKGNEPDLLAPGKRQFSTDGDEKANEAIMKNIRQWRKEALEILMRVESKK